MQLAQYFAGMAVATGRSQSTGIATRSAVGALHHSDAYASVNGSTTGTQHYYVTGLLGVSDQLGNTVDQVITGLQRSVAADGTKPTGTIYFEENDNARSDIREPQWLAVQAELTARGIPFVEESDVSGGTPLNRNDVRGAVVGNAEALVPNGSTYGANGSLIVALSSAPASAVAVDVQPVTTGQLNPSTTSLTFTPSNWSVPQTVTLSAVDNDRVDGNRQVTLNLSVAAGSDLTWLNVGNASVTVTIVDEFVSEELVALDLSVVDTHGNALDVNGNGRKPKLRSQ